MQEEGRPFFQLLPAYSETVRGKSLSKSHCLTRRFEIHRPFSAFSENHLGFTGSRIPSQWEKMPVTMRPES
jgi:hypothetical protein